MFLRFRCLLKFNRINPSIRNMSILRSALIQSKVGTNRDDNLQNATRLIKEAKQKGARLVVLPECFNSPYGTKFFEQYAEPVPSGPTCSLLAATAKEHDIYLVGGTIPEVADGKYFNTCTVWSPTGELLATFRKIHLFDIDIPGGITFKESDILTGGASLATFVADDVKVGLGVCYDMRFEELAKVYRKQDCHLLVYPGAFNMTTGPIHWELLQRGRALDNQVWVFAVSPARSEKGYIAWGHSQITDPWGKVVAQAGHGEEIVYGDVNLEECKKAREQIPIFVQRRTDIYDTVCKI